MRRALAAGLAVLVAAVVALWIRADEPPPVTPAPALAGVVPTPPAPALVPATPEHPSGRFLPTWLPGQLRVAVEQEWAASRSGLGWTRTYIRRGPLPADQDGLTISLEDGAPALDVDLEVSRTAGARRATVQGSPALFLGPVAARHDTALVWSPAPGRLAQVLGSGVSEEELAGVAEGFRLPPRVDLTPVPDGFTEVQRADDRSFPASIPRQYAVGTLPLRGPAWAPGTPSVQVSAGWAGDVPAAGTPVTVRDRTGVATTDGDNTVLAWSERAGLVVTVTGTSVSLDDVRRVAAELRELSVEEVVARPTGGPAVLARGEAGGLPYQLRTYSGASGHCLELVHNWVQSQCGGDPLQPTADFEGAIFQGLAYGSVIRDAASVRIELDGGRAVETAAIAGVTSAFYVTEVPPDGQLVAVVALAADGRILERRTPAR